MTDCADMKPATPAQLDAVGRKVGRRHILAVLGRVPAGGKGRGRYFRPVFRVECDCGQVDVVKAAHWSAVAKQCHECGRAAARERLANQTTATRGDVGGHALGLAGGAPVIERGERRALARGAGALGGDWWREDGAEQRAAEAALARELGRLSLTEIGAIFGVSRERIRQIEAEALEKLRRALRSEEQRAEWRAAARRPAG